MKEEHRLRVFENRIVRRMFGCKRDEVTGSWRKVLSEKLHKVCSSPLTIRVIKSRKMRWSCMGEIRITYKIFVENSEVGDHSEDLDIDGRIILKLIL
jgi:hypothetical protein